MLLRKIPLPFDPKRDLVPVIGLDRVPLRLIANPTAVQTNSFPDFISYAKAHPDWLNFASIGDNTPHYLAFLWLQQLTGLPAAIVNYKGGAAALQAVISGEANTMIVGGSSITEMVATGKVRQLAVTSRDRVPSDPNVPAISEFYPEYAYTPFFGVVAPRGTSPQIIERYNKELNIALAQPDIVKRMQVAGTFGGGGSTGEFAHELYTRFDLVAKILAEAGVKKK